MKCKCGCEMKGILTWDDDQCTDIAINASVCERCGMIFKETPTAVVGYRELWIPPTLTTLENDEEITAWIKKYESH